MTYIKYNKHIYNNQCTLTTKVRRYNMVTACLYASETLALVRKKSRRNQERKKKNTRDKSHTGGIQTK